MKELSIEEKAKRYNEALERARKLQENSNGMILKKWLWNIFPELKENEGERIRKALINYLITDEDNGVSKVGQIPIDNVIAWLEKQGEQKTADEVEPKFHEGDWVVRGQFVTQIREIAGDGYVNSHNGFIPFESAKYYYLWTIQDAMDGDVLVSRSPFIYGKQCPYGGLNWCNNKFIKASNFIFTDSPVHPATKEQRDFLFQKMKEAGYTFDFKNKELKKLSQSEVTKISDQEEIAEIPFGAKDSELQEATYYIPKGFYAEIDDDKVVIEKGEKLIEWSEEDEHRVKDTIYFLDTAKKHYASTVELEACIDWLKSLKQRIGG